MKKRGIIIKVVLLTIIILQNFQSLPIYSESLGSSKHISLKPGQGGIAEDYVAETYWYEDGDGYSGVLRKELIKGVPPQTKWIAENSELTYLDPEQKDYGPDIDGYEGKLDKILIRGEEGGTKTIKEIAELNSPPTKSYDYEGFTGILTKVQTGGYSLDTKWVTNQDSIIYNVDNYVGFLS